MNPQIKKRLLDLMWAGLMAAATAFAAAVIPGLKELLGDVLTQNAPAMAAAFTILAKN